MFLIFNSPSVSVITVLFLFVTVSVLAGVVSCPGFVSMFSFFFFCKILFFFQFLGNRTCTCKKGRVCTMWAVDLVQHSSQLDAAS